MACGLWLPKHTHSQARFDANPFTCGVASGSPNHHSVVLWTRLEQGSRLGTVATRGARPDSVAVRWEMAHDEHFQRMVQSGQSAATADLGYSVHVDVAGLEPDRWYHYRFMAGTAVSATGRTRTFPAPGTPAARLRLAYASCQRWEHGHYSAYRHMLAENLDAVLFLGDYMYEYPGAANAVRTVKGGWAMSLDDYRARYALYKSDVHLQAMHAACPWLVTWDDHEVQNDYAATTAGNNAPPWVDFARRRAAAYQAFYENMPLRSSVLTRAMAGLVTGAEMRIFGAVPFGNLATLHLLDDRQYRDPQVCGKVGNWGGGSVNPANCPNWKDPQRTLLGRVQEQWLDKAFSQGSRTWNVVGQQTVFGQRDFRPGAGQLLSNDGWDGYASSRTRVTDSMQRHRLANPVLLGGDVHANWVGHVKADYAHPESATIGVEFCGTSITSRSGANEHVAKQLAENPHFVFADRERRGYGVLEFTPKQLTTTLRVVSDVTRADAGIETLAQFVVEAGRPQIAIV
jgi:alkaline phosphatase D